MSKKKSQSPTIRSSSAEYLTFIAAGGDLETSVEMRYENENIWLTQKMMATLYDVSVAAINQHLKRIFADNELEREATIKQYLIVQTEGNRQVQRDDVSIANSYFLEYEQAQMCKKMATLLQTVKA